MTNSYPNGHLIPQGYYACQYIDANGNRKWRLYDGESSNGILVADSLDWHELKRKWEEYTGTKGMRRR